MIVRLSAIVLPTKSVFKKILSHTIVEHCMEIKFHLLLLNRLKNADPEELFMTGTLNSFDVTDRLHEITVPSLFSCGRYDEATPETTGYYQKQLTGSQLNVFKDALHAHHLEKEAGVLATVREFLRGTGSYRKF